jgi:hypothetical protein
VQDLAQSIDFLAELVASYVFFVERNEKDVNGWLTVGDCVVCSRLITILATINLCPTMQRRIELAATERQKEMATPRTLGHWMQKCQVSPFPHYL